MEDRQYARFKRILEYYQADPEFRIFIRESPGEAARLFELPTDDGGTILEATEAILFKKAYEYGDQKYVEGYLERNRQVAGRSTELMGKARYRDPKVAAYVERNLNRSRMESKIFRTHSQIRYLPLAFELSKGCRVNCPFCGLNAESWKRDFSYYEGRNLWRSIIGMSKDILGDIADQAPLYYATEPLDNPDYEAFLRDADELFESIPQTTTAVPERDIARTKNLIRFLGRDRLIKEGRLRFSIRTIPQFKKIMSAFSFEELEGIELIMNNPDSVNAISLSGRFLNMKNGETGGDNRYEKRLPVRYSISCLSGIKVSLCDKKMSFIEPYMPDEKHPDGTRVLDTALFKNADDYAALFKAMFDRCGRVSVSEDVSVILNPEVKIRERESDYILMGDETGYKIKKNLFTERILWYLKDTKTGLNIKELNREIVLEEKAEKDLKCLLDDLLMKGYVVIDAAYDGA